MDPMTADREARIELQNALVGYMAGEIRTFEFDDRKSTICSRNETADDGLRQVSRFLYGIHDDLIDHPSSISPQGWATLRRIVAFLGTELEIDATDEHPAWPLHDEDTWRANEWIVSKAGLPDYDPAIHGRQNQRWWNRIPFTVGFAILGGILIVVLIVLILM